VITPLIHVTSVIVALKTVSLLLGALVAYFAFKAYRRTDAAPLGYLALGFAIVTLGALLAGVVDRFLPYPAQWALVVESGLTAVGFAVIVYSLYTR
jgi:low affinity Fe/Cu permease